MVPKFKSPFFGGWLEKYPDFEFDLHALRREYDEFIKPLMTLPIKTTMPGYNGPATDTVPNLYHVYLDDYREIISSLPETLKACEAVREIFDFSHATYRCLVPSTAYTWHHDECRATFHIPIYTNFGSKFVFDDKTFSMDATGGTYIINTGRPHTAVNAGLTPRIHLTFQRFNFR